MKYSYERDENKKETLKGPLLDDIAPFYLTKLDAHVKENNGFLANGKVSFFGCQLIYQLNSIYDILVLN